MFKLALPVILSYLGLMAMPLVDLFAVGHVSAIAVGAVGIGTSLFTWFMMFGLGLLAGLEYRIAHSHGAGEHDVARAAFAQGLIISVGLGIPFTLLILGAAECLEWLRIGPEVRPFAASYLRILAYSLIPVLAFTAARNFLQARGIAKPVLVILIAANVFNAIANYVLVYGHWGFAPGGSDGSAWATMVARVWMLFAVLAYVYYYERRRTDFQWREYFRYDPLLMRSLLKLGFPSALQVTFEVGVFALSTVLAGGLAPVALAAHQIVLNTASFTFMVPLGLSSATAVLVGQASGRGDLVGARRLGWQGLSLGMGFMAFSGATLWLFSGAILSFYTSEAEVILAAQQIILVAALFQVSDGAQVVATGALRGLGNTRTAAIANLLGHWGIGLPVGVLLCYAAGWGLRGLWNGLALGLTAVGIALVWRWSIESRRALTPA